MSIGSRIKQRRIELGLDADELARKIGKSRATVYRYENGDIENMPTPVLEPIAKALETTPAYLMGWEEKEISSSDEDLDTVEMFMYKKSGTEYLSKFLDFDCRRIVNLLALLSQSGKKEAEKRLYELSLIPQYQATSTDKVYDFSNVVTIDSEGIYRHDEQGNILNAAHERTDTEVTEEMCRHDDDIMADDSEWK